VKDEPPDWLKGRKIAEAIANLEKQLQDKHGPNWPDRPTKTGPGTGQDARGSSPSVASRAPGLGSKGSASPAGEKALEEAKKKVEAEIGNFFILLLFVGLLTHYS
jgi:hypothetical protein